MLTVRPTTSSVPNRRRASDWVMSIVWGERSVVPATSGRLIVLQDVVVGEKIILGREGLPVLDDHRLTCSARKPTLSICGKSLRTDRFRHVGGHLQNSEVRHPWDAGYQDWNW